MQDPLKQGLKPMSFVDRFDLELIRMQDPLKQGLKLEFVQYVFAGMKIRMQDPLKQGLKPVKMEWYKLSTNYSNARSIKTRIETYIYLLQTISNFRDSNARSIKTRIETEP